MKELVCTCGERTTVTGIHRAALFLLHTLNTPFDWDCPKCGKENHVGAARVKLECPRCGTIHLDECNFDPVPHPSHADKS